MQLFSQNALAYGLHLFQLKKKLLKINNTNFLFFLMTEFQDHQFLEFIFLKN